MVISTPLSLQSQQPDTGTASPASVLVDTADQVKQQFSIVNSLFQQNARFLDASEKAWIDHILKSSGLLIDEFGHLTESETEVAGTRRQWIPSSTFFQQMNKLLKDSSAGKDDLRLLLVAAQSLNSAIGLLSCCRDRWEFYQTTRQANNENMVDPSVDELSQMMNRRRRRQTLDSNGLVRLNSLHLHRGRSSTSERAVKDKTIGNPTDNWSLNSSQNIRSGISDSDRSNRLSLAIVETVEKWRQNAEYALSRTSALGFVEDLAVDKSDGSMSVVEEDFRETSSNSGHVRDRTASFDSDPIPLETETIPKIITQSRELPPIGTRDTYHTIFNSHQQVPNSSTSPTYNMSRRKPLASQRFAAHTLSTRTSASTSTNNSAGSASTSNSTSTRSSTSPNLLRPASISLRNSWEKESVIHDANEGVDIPERLRPRTSSAQSSIPEALAPSSSGSSPQQQYLPYRPLSAVPASISPWSSQTTLLPQHNHSSTGSVDSSFQRPNEYRISRGRAWLERQAANEV